MQSVEIAVTRENLEEVYPIIEQMNWHQLAIRELDAADPLLLDVYLGGRSIVAPENLDPANFEAYAVFAAALKEATRAYLEAALVSLAGELEQLSASKS
ncbi:MAG: hypothetical protein ABL908_03065 [Hyphomicrobium sp.]